MGIEQKSGLVIAKAPTGPSKPAIVRRNPFAKLRPIPKKELYNRLVRTKSPPRKSVRAPAQGSNLHPQRVEKSFAGLEEQKKEQRDTYVAAKWDDIYDPARPNLYQDYLGSIQEKKDKAEWKAWLYAHRLAQGRGGGRVDKRRHGSARLGGSKER